MKFLLYLSTITPVIRIFCDFFKQIIEAFALSLDIETLEISGTRGDKLNAHVSGRGLTYTCAGSPRCPMAVSWVPCPFFIPQHIERLSKRQTNAIWKCTTHQNLRTCRKFSLPASQKTLCSLKAPTSHSITIHLVQCNNKTHTSCPSSHVITTYCWGTPACI